MLSKWGLIPIYPIYKYRWNKIFIDPNLIDPHKPFQRDIQVTRVDSLSRFVGVPIPYPLRIHGAGIFTFTFG